MPGTAFAETINPALVPGGYVIHPPTCPEIPVDADQRHLAARPGRDFLVTQERCRMTQF